MVRWLSGKVIKWPIAYELSSLCQSRLKNANPSRNKTARGREGRACGAHPTALESDVVCSTERTGMSLNRRRRAARVDRALQ